MQITRLGSTALLAMSLLAAAGCTQSWRQAAFTRDIEATFALPEGVGIFAQTDNGSVTFSEAEREDLLVRARVRATTQARADAVQVVAAAGPGDWLQIEAVWPSTRQGSEGVAFEIEAPGGRPVRARSSNGRITLTGFAGGADLGTSNGSITVRGHHGPIVADTSNGSVKIDGADAPVTVDTSNGSVEVSLADEGGGPLKIDTSNGSITVVVGPGFSGRLAADTSNASVSVDGAGAPGVSLLTDRRTEKVVQVGESNVQSTIDTSNGSIKLVIRR